MAVSQPRYSKSDRLLARHPDTQVWLSRVGSRYARRFSACSRRGVAWSRGRSRPSIRPLSVSSCAARPGQAQEIEADASAGQAPQDGVW